MKSSSHRATSRTVAVHVSPPFMVTWMRRPHQVSGEGADVALVASAPFAVRQRPGTPLGNRGRRFRSRWSSGSCDRPTRPGGGDAGQGGAWGPRPTIPGRRPTSRASSMPRRAAGREGRGQRRGRGSWSWSGPGSESGRVAAGRAGNVHKKERSRKEFADPAASAQGAWTPDRGLCLFPSSDLFRPT